VTTARVITGDAVEELQRLPAGSVQTCVTSPPYYGLRDYGVSGQIGLEESPDAYVAKLVAVFREVRRVLRDDGTIWVNLGDSYSGSGPSGASYQSKTTLAREGRTTDGAFRISKTLAARGLTYAEKKPIPAPGLKPKDLIGIPWRVAFALQADGWYLRQDIIWSKPNPMPESVRDRCTKAHEYIFLLSKGPRYYFDSEAIREPYADGVGKDRLAAPWLTDNPGARRNDAGRMRSAFYQNGGRNRRSVWHVATRPYKGAHFATFPPALIEPCILAGCPVGGTVLDPFAGSGTTLAVALSHGRNGVGIELNPEYVTLAQARIGKVTPPLTGAVA
jgi:DNA modification methylase